MKKYFSTFDAARICNVSPTTVNRWVAEGKLRASRTMGGHKRIKAADLIALLKQLDMPVPDDFSDPAETEVTQSCILVVDDDSSIRKLISRFLKQEFPDSQIEEAKDGFSAGWIVQEKHPQVILLDLHLPGIDGYEVCELIRKSTNFRQTKIIAATGAGADARERIMRLGADEFLQKPFDLNELKSVVARLMPASFISQAKGAD